MNPKIKNLIEELMHECNESDVAITLGAIDPSADEATVVFGGTFALQTIVLTLMNEKFKECMRTNDCDCPACKATKEMMFNE